MSYKAFLFDAYGTLFDVHSVMEKINEYYPEQSSSISQQWRSRQIHYFLVNQLTDRYRPFDQVTRSALLDALEHAQVSYEPSIVDDLMKQYEMLSPYSEVSDLLEKHPDKSFTIFSNGTASMLKPLLENNQLTQAFELLCADDPGVYKPHPDAYDFAQKKLGFNKEDILFFSSNPWDIAGAASYGFSTAWVNRSQQKWPELGINPTITITDLNQSPQ